eukprot:4262048-Alexandrium_andersonii.AAC.1
MSASLVGSEMCIRDRRTAPRRPFRSDWPGCRRPRPCSLPSSEVFCVWPVSYTHLTLPTICSV